MPNKAKKLNLDPQECRICGVPAVYSHFGVISCQPCKMFFKRNANIGQAAFICKFGGECEINENTRHICSSCRLDKCFKCGMTIDKFQGSRQTKPKKNALVKVQIQPGSAEVGEKKTNIDLMLIAGQREVDQKREPLLKLNEKIIITLLDVVRFLSRQSLSFQGYGNSEGNFVATINLLRRRDPVLDQWLKESSLCLFHVTYLHHDSQNEHITLLSRVVIK
ncbi:unnamed protein product [Rotaria sordida]|uniref:Nuclear receptor domain-containing protein n=1 Tax=Rotaria sordida TaxID=392033 RepID=A0A818XF61_9BILA|nr:unnamed protein product [Rotaria sordida]